jgi:flagellar hook protein FlgE
LARTEGLIELSQAETSFKANAAVIRAEDDLSEQLLDISV